MGIACICTELKTRPHHTACKARLKPLSPSCPRVWSPDVRASGQVLLGI